MEAIADQAKLKKRQQARKEYNKVSREIRKLEKRKAQLKEKMNKLK